MAATDPDVARARLRRHLLSMSGRGSRLHGAVRILLRPWLLPLRLLLGLLLVLCGLVSFLPVLGFWMLPLGIILIAIDAPFLAPVVANLLTRARWWWRRRRRSSTSA